ncbi:MAG: hypothetical protein QFB87_00640 [Patescibacteria group bacterium]|nr:hypothetical protein [Patescibacteria group bacterium]
MSLLASIFIGIIVGGGAGFLLIENLDSLIINIVFGLVGSILALVLFYIFDAGQTSTMVFSWRGALCCAIGALIVVILFNGLQRAMPKRINKAAVDEGSKIDED